MSTWDRAPYDTLCGCCGLAIPRGHVRFTLRSSADFGGRSFTRCEACAGDAAPDLPPLGPPMRAEIVPIPKLSARPLLSLVDRVKQWRDGKVAAIGREPGEDDE